MCLNKSTLKGILPTIFVSQFTPRSLSCYISTSMIVKYNFVINKKDIQNLLESNFCPEKSEHKNKLKPS